jgi:hypothetical protein
MYNPEKCATPEVTRLPIRMTLLPFFVLVGQPLMNDKCGADKDGGVRGNNRSVPVSHSVYDP